VFLTNTDGTGLGTNVATGLKMLTRFAPFDVATSNSGELTGLAGEPLPVGATHRQFHQGRIAGFFSDTDFSARASRSYDHRGWFRRLHAGHHGHFHRGRLQRRRRLDQQRADLPRHHPRDRGRFAPISNNREVFILVPPKPMTVG